MAARSHLMPPHSGTAQNTEPQNLCRRRLSISFQACCILPRSSRLIALITDLSLAASGGYCSSTCIGARNWMCHFEGNGSGNIGNVGVMGMQGHSVYRVQARELILPNIGKISALPTTTNGTMGARFLS